MTMYELMYFDRETDREFKIFDDMRNFIHSESQIIVFAEKSTLL